MPRLSVWLLVIDLGFLLFLKLALYKYALLFNHIYKMLTVPNTIY